MIGAQGSWESCTSAVVTLRSVTVPVPQFPCFEMEQTIPWALRQVSESVSEMEVSDEMGARELHNYIEDKIFRLLWALSCVMV